MLATYKATLRGNFLEWADAPPASLDSDHPLAVHVTILEEPTAASPTRAQTSEQLAALLDQIALLNPFAEIDDPVAWQQDTRRDRPLPGREP